MKTNHLSAALLTAGLLYSATSSAVIVLDFEGAGNVAALQNFYNGGTDSLGNSGTNYGVTFNGATLSIIDADAGGTGNFANEPSPSTVMFFLDANNGVLDYASGFNNGFSFFYSSSTAAAVNVWSGLSATGTLLASLNLTAQGFDNCVGDPTGSFCNWTAVGVNFAGIAQSIDFGGTANQTGYDNITFGSSTPGNVPEPAILALLGLGFSVMTFAKRRAKA